MFQSETFELKNIGYNRKENFRYPNNALAPHITKHLYLFPQLVFSIAYKVVVISESPSRNTRMPIIAV